MTTTEAGGTAAFTVVLDSQPSASVTIGASSTDTGEGVVSSWSLTFAPGVWNTSQTVTVTGLEDGQVDGDILFNITTAAFNSSDSNFNGLPVADMRNVVNMDGMHPNTVTHHPHQENCLFACYSYLLFWLFVCLSRLLVW
jgi:hypothetical protein